MALRMAQLLIGVLLAAGGGYLAWVYRALAASLFPPDPGSANWPLIAAIACLVLGGVLAIGALLPQGSSKQRLAEQDARRQTAIETADAFYAERARAADRDWRSGDLPPEAAPRSVPPVETPTAPVAPELELAPASAPSETTPPGIPAEPSPPLARQTVEPPPLPLAEADQPAPPKMPALDPGFVTFSLDDETPAASKATAPIMSMPGPLASAPFATQVAVADKAALKPDREQRPITDSAIKIPFPSSPARPIPAASDAPGQTLPSSHPHTQVAAPPPQTPLSAAPLDRIRGAISENRLEDAERLLAEERTRLNITGETERLTLAELTGLAGDHAAAAGRVGGAKWLWRLSLQRFAAADAISSAAARAVSDRLRLADQ